MMQRLAIHCLLANEPLAERPVRVYQRHADRRIGVQHLLRRNDLDLIGIGVEAEVGPRHVIDRVIGPIEGIEIPIGTFEQWLDRGRYTHLRTRLR